MIFLTDPYIIVFFRDALQPCLRVETFSGRVEWPLMPFAHSLFRGLSIAASLHSAATASTIRLLYILLFTSCRNYDTDHLSKGCVTSNICQVQVSPNLERFPAASPRSSQIWSRLKRAVENGEGEGMPEEQRAKDEATATPTARSPRARSVTAREAKTA